MRRIRKKQYHEGEVSQSFVDLGIPNGTLFSRFKLSRGNWIGWAQIPIWSMGYVKCTLLRSLNGEPANQSQSKGFPWEQIFRGSSAVYRAEYA